MKYSELRQRCASAEDRARGFQRRAEEAAALTVSKLRFDPSNPDATRMSPNRVGVLQTLQQVDGRVIGLLRDTPPTHPAYAHVLYLQRHAIEQMGEALIQSGHLELLPESPEHRRERLATGIASYVHQLRVFR